MDNLVSLTCHECGIPLCLLGIAAPFKLNLSHTKEGGGEDGGVRFVSSRLVLPFLAPFLAPFASSPSLSLCLYRPEANAPAAFRKDVWQSEGHVLATRSANGAVSA